VVWAVKEAAAKATGRGLQGRPKDLEIVECAGGNAHLATGVRLAYEPLSKEHIVAWTRNH
jgi:phosphopantetheinyl transferase (holo-ACP synthase)